MTWQRPRRPTTLRSCVRGKSNHHIPDAAPYPMHSDYIDRAFHYGAELYRPEPNTDLQRFEPSPLPPEEMARRALRVASVAERSGTALEEAWRGGFDAAMDESVFDEDGDGPLCRFTLYASSSSSAALLYQANHAISDQLSFNLLLAELLEARDRAEIEPRSWTPHFARAATGDRRVASWRAASAAVQPAAAAVR